MRSVHPSFMWTLGIKLHLRFLRNLFSPVISISELSKTNCFILTDKISPQAVLPPPQCMHIYLCHISILSLLCNRIDFLSFFLSFFCIFLYFFFKNLLWFSNLRVIQEARKSSWTGLIISFRCIFLTRNSNFYLPNGKLLTSFREFLQGVYYGFTRVPSPERGDANWSIYVIGLWGSPQRNETVFVNSEHRWAFLKACRSDRMISNKSAALFIITLSGSLIY